MDIKFINKLIEILKANNFITNNSTTYNFRKIGTAFCDYIRDLSTNRVFKNKEEQELYEEVYNEGLYIHKIELASSLGLIDEIPYFIIKDIQRHYVVFLENDKIKIHGTKRDNVEDTIKDFLLFIGKDSGMISPLPPEKETTRDLTNIPKPAKGVNIIKKAINILKKSWSESVIDKDSTEIIEILCNVLTEDNDDILDELQTSPDEVEVKKISLSTAIPFIYCIGRTIDPDNIEAWKGFFIYNDGKNFRAFVPENGNWEKKDSPKISYLPDYNRCFAEFEQLFPEEERSDFREDKIKKSSSEDLLELQKALSSFKGDKDISKILSRVDEELNTRRDQSSNIDKNMFVGNYYKYNFPTNKSSYSIFYIKAYDSVKNNFIADIISFDGFNSETDELEGIFITFNQEIVIQTHLDKSRQGSFNILVDKDKLYYNETILNKFTNPGMLVIIKDLCKTCSQIKAEK